MVWFTCFTLVRDVNVGGGLSSEGLLVVKL